MSRLPKVAVVILNWNGRFFLEKFLPSVYNSSYPNVEFVIGDNASDDDSILFVKQYYPTITVLENDENYGFAGGYNKVIARVEADYYILLNSDVEVSQNWIEPVIAYMERNPNIAAAQPKILSYHRKEQFEHAGAAGGYLDYLGYPFCRGRILHEVEQDQAQYDLEAEVFWASGAALFIRERAWKEADGLDEDFFAHMEEIDLCWRLKKMGYAIGYCPASVVYHVGGGTLNASNPKKTYLNFRNNLIMLQKNLPLAQAIWIIFLRLWFDFAALLKFLVDRKPKDAWAISRAHQYFFLNIFKNARKRKKYKCVEDQRGWYKKSIIIDFYLNNKHKFSQLNPKDFK